MKNNRFYIGISLLLLCALCGGILYSCFLPPSNTPCMPISYPEGTKIKAEQGKIYTFETSDSYDDIYKFIKANLKLAPQTEDSYEWGTWEEYSIRDIGVLFECFSNLDSYHSELGCIFINKNNDDAIIYAMWSFNEGPGIPCDELPKIEPEDY